MATMLSNVPPNLSIHDERDRPGTDAEPLGKLLVCPMAGAIQNANLPNIFSGQLSASVRLSAWVAGRIKASGYLVRRMVAARYRSMLAVFLCVNVLQILDAVISLIRINVINQRPTFWRFPQERKGHKAVDPKAPRLPSHANANLRVAAIEGRAVDSTCRVVSDLTLAGNRAVGFGYLTPLFGCGNVISSHAVNAPNIGGVAGVVVVF